MKTHELNLPFSEPRADHMSQVNDLDDGVLRRSHALLDDSRSREFSCWIDQRLEGLEGQFQDFMTHRSIRKSLGR